MLARGRGTLLLRIVVDERMEQASLYLHLLEAERRGCGRERRETRRIDEIDQIGIERVVLYVGRQIDIPPGADRELVSRGEVGLVLTVAVVNVHRRHVLPRVGEIMQKVVGVLGIHRETVPAGERLVETALHEEIGVPLPVLVAESARLLAHEGAGIAPLGVVEVDLRPPRPVLDPAEEPLLDPQGAHVAVAAHGRGVVSVGLDIGEPVSSRRVEVLGIERTGDAVGQPLLVEHRGIHRPERTALERQFQPIAPLRIEIGRAGLQIDGTGRGIILGRLDSRALLPVVEGHGGHVVERILAQVDLSVLG